MTWKEPSGPYCSPASGESARGVMATPGSKPCNLLYRARQAINLPGPFGEGVGDVILSSGALSA